MEMLRFLFSALCGKKELRWTTELARVAGRETVDTWLDDVRFGKDCVNKLLEELDITKLDRGLCDYLDTIKLDENLQFLRLSADYCGSPSWKVVKYRCQLANESESFYRCRVSLGRSHDPSQSQPSRISGQDQLLCTVIQQEPDGVEIRSNVVPWQAYLAGMNATCRRHGLCTGGFAPISVLREAEPCRQSCRNCALAEQLRGGAQIDAGLEKLWDLEKDDVETVPGHSHIGTGSEGTVEKIYWRKGVFAKKTFISTVAFEREMEIATEVSHPNIVHCFGTSIGGDGTSLFMELLEESLESRLQQPIQDCHPFSFQDILDILWQVADAMKQLHEKSFIHGDLKPGNILLSRLTMPHSKSGKFHLVKVADFGCAQRVPPEGFADPESANADTGATGPGLFHSGGGTTHYTAPEVFRHRMDKAPPKHPKMIDVYSFGVVAYQMLTGVTELYEMYGSRVTDIKNGIMQGELRPDSGFNGTLVSDGRESLLPLVRSCWDPNPEVRPPFSEICEELKTRLIECGENGTRSIEHRGNDGMVLHFKLDVELSGTAIIPCVGDVLAKLLRATITMCCNKDSIDASADSTDSTDSAQVVSLG